MEGLQSSSKFIMCVVVTWLQWSSVFWGNRKQFTLFSFRVFFLFGFASTPVFISSHSTFTWKPQQRISQQSFLFKFYKSLSALLAKIGCDPNLDKKMDGWKLSLTKKSKPSVVLCSFLSIKLGLILSLVLTECSECALKLKILTPASQPVCASVSCSASRRVCMSPQRTRSWPCRSPACQTVFRCHIHKNAKIFVWCWRRLTYNRPCVWVSVNWTGVSLPVLIRSCLIPLRSFCC